MRWCFAVGMATRYLADRIHLSVPHMGGGELEYVRDAFESNWLSTVGPHIDAFETEMAAHLGGNVHAVAVSSGTSALHVALRAAGVGTGDHVAVSTLTFAGSVFPILYLGATPVFVDSDYVSWNLDPNAVEQLFVRSKRSNTLPKALVAVHLYGQHADLDPLRALCARFGVTLIEDAAESLGATYRGRETATTGEFAILSFNGNKVITTTGGGMVLTKAADDAARIRKWINQSRELGLEYVHRELGYNFRLSNVLAAIGRAQLKYLRERVAARRAVARRYAEAFDGIADMDPQPEPAWGVHSRWLSAFSLPRHIDPRHVVTRLASEHIEARLVWRPMHTQPMFTSAPRVGGRVAETIFGRGLCLPSSSSLTASDQSRVIDAVVSALAAEASARTRQRST
jgi:pyridoxal phosphate-dependent aminotransferase EpsN